MIRLPETDLAATPLRWLDTWQSEVDAESGFPARVAKAKSHFSSKNSRSNRTFQAVKEGLRSMQGNLVRCAYCEDSAADEVEHIFPKDLYPDQVFRWENYTYACGPCNGPKNNKFAVFREGDGVEVDVTPPHHTQRPDDWEPMPPPEGDALLINPRQENPLNLLWLDLVGTFRIDPLMDLEPRDQRRAEYTCELLGLNRDLLIRARAHAYLTFKSLLMAAAEDAAPSDETPEYITAIKESPHQTVWQEMKRQRQLVPELASLFDAIPEAEHW